MEHIFIVNPAAGRRDAGKEMIPLIVQTCQRLGVKHTIMLTEYPGHAAEIACEYAAMGDQVRLYACGGDGTYHEVLQGLVGTAAAAGCIPCGSGNDFVRNFGGKEAFLDLEAMLQGRVVPIDMIKTEYGYAATTCSAGLDAQVAFGIDRWRTVPGCGGSVAYFLSIFQQLCGKIGQQMTITVDDDQMEGEYILAAVCNGVAYGGGFHAAPEAKMNDGLMDVVLVKNTSKPKILSLLLAYKNGRHIHDGSVIEKLTHLMQFRRARRVEIRPTPGEKMIVNVDGECAARETLTAEIQPLAVNVILQQQVLSFYR